jgi:hypothetical protein
MPLLAPVTIATLPLSLPSPFFSLGCSSAIAGFLRVDWRFKVQKFKVQSGEGDIEHLNLEL